MWSGQVVTTLEEVTARSMHAFGFEGSWERA